MNNLSNFVGFTLYANYGAMYPVCILTVKNEEDGLLVCEGDNDVGTVYIKPSEIKNKKPNCGSPIGVYFNEQDVY